MIPRWLQLAGVLMAVLAMAGRGLGAEFRDAFADREVLTTAEGRLSGDNTGATVESGEPRHGGKVPGHSLWISWVAPANGLATLRLTGVGYDTLLAVYQVRPDEPPELRRLERVVENDDEDEVDDVASSGVQFGVRAGERFEIAVDGFAGATGPFVMEWHLEPVDELIPRIVLVTGDRAARVGDRVILEATLGAGDEPKLHWEFNGDELEDEEELTLIIPSFQESHVGRYRVRVEIAKTKFFSAAVELQISSEGVITALARNKPEDALESPLSGAPPPGAPVQARALATTAAGAFGLTRGYNGTQIFNTVFAGRDANEPVHCGIPGGASYWFAYAPPQSGWLDLDTQGSAFDTVLEVYTYDPPLLGYASLQTLACDNNGGPDGRSSRLRLRCETGRTYLIVVDGVNGARGLTHLNYRLETNGVVVVPPQAGPAPGPFAVAAGTRLELTVGAEGSAPLRYQWKLGTTVLESATNATLVLDAAALNQAGAYSVAIRNDAGAAESGPILVSVWIPPRVELAADGRSGRLRFAAAGEAAVSLEASDSVGGNAWTVAARAAPGGAPVEVAIPAATTASFFRIRID